MKLKIGISALLLSMAGLSALIFAIINDLGSTPAPKAEPRGAQVLIPEPAATLDLKKKPEVALKKIQAPTIEDELLIKQVALLSEAELLEEHEKMAKRVTEENLLIALEEHRLDHEETIRAKAFIERFTLLSLEATRRKYLAVEPELKDALYAHRDSLKDIREVLSRY